MFGRATIMSVLRSIPRCHRPMDMVEILVRIMAKVTGRNGNICPSHHILARPTEALRTKELLSYLTRESAYMIYYLGALFLLEEHIMCASYADSLTQLQNSGTLFTLAYRRRHRTKRCRIVDNSDILPCLK